MRSILATILVFPLFTLLSCGQANNPPKPELSYLILTPDLLGLSRQVDKPIIDICVAFISPDGNSVFGEPSDEEIGTTSLSDEDIQRAWLQHAQNAVEAWIKPLQKVSSTPLAKVKTHRADEPGNCMGDLSIHARSNQGVAAPTYDGVSISIGEYDSTPFRTTLHEFGHGFGLDDTYAGGGGACKAGQPNSVMCSLVFDELQPDDIAGIIEVYRRVHGGQ